MLNRVPNCVTLGCSILFVHLQRGYNHSTMDRNHSNLLDCTPMTGQIRLGESGGGGHYPPE
jgi:hypothetical protein